METTAVYDDCTVEQIFLPVLRKWSALQEKLGRRVLIFLSAPPGVGKTTTAQFLEYLSKREQDVQEIQAIGLDGFHFHQDYILAHEACVDGKMVPMKEVQRHLRTRLRRLCSKKSCGNYKRQYQGRRSCLKIRRRRIYSSFVQCRKRRGNASCGTHKKTD